MIEFDINDRKEKLDEIASQIIWELGEGERDPLELAAYCKKGIALFESIIKQSYTFILDEKEKNPEKELSKFNVKFSLSSTGERLDYDSDVEYKSINTKLKDRQALLKTAYKSKDIIFDSEGDQVPKVDLKSPSKQILKIEVK